MIDLHMHTFLSDGELIPSELVRRAQVAGLTAIAITDHVDHSNIDMVLPAIIKVSEVLNKYWDIVVIPGVEVTHVPIEVFPELTLYARKMGAKIVVAHGESSVEPVLPGTNAAAIGAGVDILAHPGLIREDVATLAAEKGVFLEITTRKGHSETNQHVFDMAVKTQAGMVLNTDTHAPEDIISPEKRIEVLRNLTALDEVIENILKNSETLLQKLKSIKK
ncbi:MAG: histidinol phosphate phosphatase domain-containing protein [Candidatus Omnitrophota bacterium]